MAVEKSALDSLRPQERLRRIAVALSWVQRPEDVFGPKQPKKVFRTLSKLLHPDAGGDAAAFQKLNALWELAEQRIKDKDYGTSYDSFLLGSGDVADCFQQYDCDQWAVYKVGRSSADNDLLVKEVGILATLAAQSPDDVAKYYPILVSSETDWGGTHTTVLRYDHEIINQPADLLTLKQLGDYYDQRMPDKHIAWIWRRLLVALAVAHRNGILHGAVTPDNILIEPVNHGLILISWIHASRNGEPLQTISKGWNAFYPKEVFDKERPRPSLDYYQAARSMIWAGGNMSEPLWRYFNWCIADNPLARPDKFNTLLEEFDRTIYFKLGWKREFVKLDDLVDWSAWWA